MVGGSFRGTLQFDDQELKDKGPFDGFIAILDESITSLGSVIKKEDQIRVGFCRRNP